MKYVYSIVNLTFNLTFLCHPGPCGHSLGPFRGSCCVKITKNSSKSTFLKLFDLIMTGNLFTFYCSPAERNWDLRIHSCPSIRSRSQNPFIGLFWLFAQCCSIISIRKWHFRFSQKNPVFAIPGQKLSKIAHFGPKTSILTIFSKFGHRILPISLIETTFMV